jgi:hypothetical protein
VKIKTSLLFTVFKNGGDIRDVISVWKLIKRSNGPEDVDSVIKTLMKYGSANNN